MLELKTCCICKKEKPKTEFHLNNSHPDGLSYFCRKCKAIRRYGKRPGDYRKRIRNRKRIKEKAEAHNYIYINVSRGNIIRPRTCEKCKKIPENRKIFGHHYLSYEKKEAVLWLCSKCHAEEHHLKYL